MYKSYYSLINISTEFWWKFIQLDCNIVIYIDKRRKLAGIFTLETKTEYRWSWHFFHDYLYIILMVAGFFEDPEWCKFKFQLYFFYLDIDVLLAVCK